MEQPRPSGTLTLLFSDIEGSTRLLTQLGVHYGEALSVQRSIMRDEFAHWHGTEIGTEGDSFFVVFTSATEAVNAALAAQRRLASYDWPDGAMVRVRMGLHTGQPTRLESDYVGMDVHRAARIASAAHGGQIVLSATTAQLIADQSPELQLKDLGWHRLKDIPQPERILQLIADDLPQEFPPLMSLGTPTNLPPAPTPIIGRDGELAEITAQLTGGAARLVTLTGPGGSGKTRLAIAAAGRLGIVARRRRLLRAAGDGEHRRCHVEHHCGDLGHRRRGPGATDLLRAHRSARHAVGPGQPRATDRCAAASSASSSPTRRSSRILATSRRPLHVTGEYQHPVPPLEIPAPGLNAQEAELWGAVALFVHRAQMVRPNFQLTDDNVADVIAICVRLDGMPLAIELAAARTTLLAPHAILSRLDRSLELGGAELDRPDRQRTLRQTIAWSFDLLTANQQKFFRQLGVFGGSCDLDAVSAVTQTPGDPLDEVAGLVDMSLVRILDDRAGEPRVDLLQTVRAFARECLDAAGEWESAARRHARPLSRPHRRARSSAPNRGVPHSP